MKGTVTMTVVEKGTDVSIDLEHVGFYDKVHLIEALISGLDMSNGEKAMAFMLIQNPNQPMAMTPVDEEENEDEDER